jgi:hypothetical protein
VTPEEALAAARAAAQPFDEGPVSLDASPVTRISDTKLVEWSVIAPELDRVYSTRRLGAPITAFKRLLIRLLRQYVDEAIAQESRYNTLATVHILNLEDRVRALEERGSGEARSDGEPSETGE